MTQLNEQSAVSRLAALVQGVVWEADPQTQRATFVSPWVETLLGFTPHEWLNAPGLWASRLHPEDRARVLASHAHSLATGEPTSVEYRFLAAGDRTVWVRDLVTPLMEQGQLVALGGVMLDITAERAQQDALAAALTRFEKVFQASPVGIALVSTASGEVQQANAAFRAVVGARLDTVFAPTAHRAQEEQGGLWPVPAQASTLQAALKAGAAVRDVHAQWHRADGEVRDVLLSAEPLDPAAGVALLMVRDVTARLQAEARLRTSERRFRALVQRSSDLLTVISPGGKMRYASPAMQAVLGHDEEEVLGENVLAHMHPDEHEAIRTEFAKAVFGGPGTTSRLTSRFRRRDGEYRWLEWVATNLLDDPDVQGMVMNSRDVTDWVLSEQALKESRRTFEVLFEASPDGVMLVDFAGDMPILHCNEVAARMKGYAPGELIGQSTYVALPNGQALLADAQANEAFRRRVREAGTLRFESEQLRKDGTIFPVEINLALLTLDGREVLLSVERDISERRAAEAALQASQARLLSSEKLAGLGRLTAGLAHEINTPLAATLNELHEATRLVQEYRDSVGHAGVTDDDHREIARELAASVDAAQRNLTRIGDFIRKIRGHTRDTVSQRRTFDAVAGVEDTLTMLAHEARAAKVNLLFERPREGVTLQGEPGRLTQVVTNLVVNAIHACPPGADVTVRFAVREGTRTLEVEDTGSGIPGDVLGRIFEPMFTTKEVGKGTGLGLSIIHDIVTGHFGGDILVDTRLGQGTTFTVTFPEAAEPAGPLAPAEQLGV
ncbi:PAS domain S-box protein [Deinococcus arcticus]|nr:PAS domain S-box protein [Deinococcus arcticus]